MDWLATLHFEGIVIGICTFLIIGLFHPIVVKAEYYWGTRCWWWFLLLGIAGIIGSVLIGDILISTLLGVFSFSSFWTIKEIFEQRERVLKGWFPMNPKRNHEYESRSGISASENYFIITDSIGLINTCINVPMKSVSFIISLLFPINAGYIPAKTVLLSMLQVHSLPKLPSHPHQE